MNRRSYAKPSLDGFGLMNTTQLTDRSTGVLRAFVVVVIYCGAQPGARVTLLRAPLILGFQSVTASRVAIPAAAFEDLTPLSERNPLINLALWRRRVSVRGPPVGAAAAVSFGPPVLSPGAADHNGHSPSSGRNQTRNLLPSELSRNRR